MPPHAMNPPFPPPPRLLRQIRDDYWRGGRQLLQEQPNLPAVRVSLHEYQEGDRWEFWVIRGPHGTFLQRTMHNGRTEEEVPLRVQ